MKSSDGCTAVLAASHLFITSKDRREHGEKAPNYQTTTSSATTTVLVGDGRLDFDLKQNHGREEILATTVAEARGRKKEVRI